MTEPGSFLGWGGSLEFFQNSGMTVQPETICYNDLQQKWKVVSCSLFSLIELKDIVTGDLKALSE